LRCGTLAHQRATLNADLVVPDNVFFQAELYTRHSSLYEYDLGAEINGETIKAFQGETLQGGRNAPEKINDKPAADSDIAA
jgi:hypothetical protein